MIYSSIELSDNDSVVLISLIVVSCNVLMMLWLVGQMLREMCFENRNSAIIRLLVKRISILSFAPTDADEAAGGGGAEVPAEGSDRLNGSTSLEPSIEMRFWQAPINPVFQAINERDAGVGPDC